MRSANMAGAWVLWAGCLAGWQAASSPAHCGADLPCWQRAAVSLQELRLGSLFGSGGYLHACLLNTVAPSLQQDMGTQEGA